MAKHKTKAYSEEFRREAVHLADKLDSAAASVAKELGIPAQIYNWCTIQTALRNTIQLVKWC